MGRHRPVRAVKICIECGDGYDALRSLDARGRMCSPQCLIARRARVASAAAMRAVTQIASDQAPAVDIIVSVSTVAPPGGASSVSDVA